MINKWNVKLLFEKGILVSCTECVKEIRRRLKTGIEFVISDDSYRDSILLVLVSQLHFDLDLWGKTPRSTRSKITKMLVKHGQFNEQEIDAIFEKYSYKSDDYTDEFVDDHPNLNVMKIMNYRAASPHKKDDCPLETKYRIPLGLGCHYLTAYGFCTVDIEYFTCPDCGEEVANFPSNVIGSRHELACHQCNGNRSDDFDTKGRIKIIRPIHHGFWDSQEPELEWVGTDYFRIFHPKCKSSQSLDGRGHMVVNGVYKDENGRIVLGLVCESCGATNAIKPFVENDDIPLLDISGGVWIRFDCKAQHLIHEEENERFERKSVLISPTDAKGMMEFQIAQAVSALMNRRGGSVLIGQKKDKETIGIEKQYFDLPRGSRDREGYITKVSEVLESRIGSHVSPLWNCKIQEADGHDLCIIEIEKASKPVFVKKQSGQKVQAVRIGAITKVLDAAEQEKYNNDWF